MMTRMRGALIGKFDENNSDFIKARMGDLTRRPKANSGLQYTRAGGGRAGGGHIAIEGRRSVYEAFNKMRCSIDEKGRRIGTRRGSRGVELFIGFINWEAGVWRFPLDLKKHTHAYGDVC
ncbi:hypothetical protein EVAR_25311_1 [Eumeta japonica]|uniref:Uncharacterized protein n=1 Tax=Eumeta variegata TaxID=151549 RepID=A0A4C1VMX3_EUMVA|nr:hypothetical protein EVAR_25311_1 [Eumeta japonica]